MSGFLNVSAPLVFFVVVYFPVTLFVAVVAYRYACVTLSPIGFDLSSITIMVGLLVLFYP